MKLYKVAYITRDVQTQIVVEDVKGELVYARSEMFARRHVEKSRKKAALLGWAMTVAEKYGVRPYQLEGMIRDGIIDTPNLVEVEVEKVELKSENIK